MGKKFLAGVRLALKVSSVAVAVLAAAVAVLGLVVLLVPGRLGGAVVEFPGAVRLDGAIRIVSGTVSLDDPPKALVAVVLVYAMGCFAALWLSVRRLTVLVLAAERRRPFDAAQSRAVRAIIAATVFLALWNQAYSVAAVAVVRGFPGGPENLMSVFTLSPFGLFLLAVLVVLAETVRCGRELQSDADLTV